MWIIIYWLYRQGCLHLRTQTLSLFPSTTSHSCFSAFAVEYPVQYSYMDIYVYICLCTYMWILIFEAERKKLKFNAGKKRVKRNSQNECLMRGKLLNGCREGKLIKKMLEMCCFKWSRQGLWWLEVCTASVWHRTLQRQRRQRDEQKAFHSNNYSHLPF